MEIGLDSFASGNIKKAVDGSVIAFLCSDDSKWNNAQRIEVAGEIRL